MKKILAALISIVLFSSLCYGATLFWNDTAIVDSMTSSSTNLSKVTAEHTIAVKLTDANASISAFAVQLEGTDSGRETADASATWYSLGTYTFTASDLTALSAMFHVVNKPVQRVRLKVSTSTGEGAGDTITGRYIEGGN